MPNIKFSYLYRDGANYKNYNSVIFDDSNNVDLAELETLIRSKLIDGTWFYVNKWNLPDLRTDSFNYERDPTWHEFETVEYTHEICNTQLDLQELSDTIKKT